MGGASVGMAGALHRIVPAPARKHNRKRRPALALFDIFKHPTEKQISGRAGEDAALDHLLRHGLTLQQRNFRCKAGEIDLVMRERETLVFVEVRKRAGGAYGGALASITPAKQRRLLLAAQFYLQRFRPPPPCRFDVIAIEGGSLQWLKNAIQA
jgi:putative endonuclease